MTAVAWPRAREIAHAAGSPLPGRAVDVAEGTGRVLAAPVRALASLPPFTAAAMDGWAVSGPGPWRVIGSILAGHPPAPAALGPGTALGIATGAAVPASTDAVVPLETGHVSDDLLVADVVAGRHLRVAGEEAAAGDVLLQAGTVLTPAGAGLAAAGGNDQVVVHALPRVHALVTGDELLRSGLPGAGRVRDAVGPALPAVVAAYGAALVATEQVRDDPDVLAHAIAVADADVVVVVGASSIGPADHLPRALFRLSAQTLVGGVRVRPGHPQTLARLPDGRLLVGLPGNPLAAFAAMATVLAPLLAGLGARPLPPLLCARAGVPLTAAIGDHRLVPVQLREGNADPTGHSGSAMLRGAAVADGFGVVEPGRDVAGGEPIWILPLP